MSTYDALLKAGRCLRDGHECCGCMDAACPVWTQLDLNAESGIDLVVEDTNTITLNLVGRALVCTVNINGSIFGQVYPTREVALEKYFTEAATLQEKGLLGEDSSILD